MTVCERVIVFTLIISAPAGQLGFTRRSLVLRSWVLSFFLKRSVKQN